MKELQSIVNYENFNPAVSPAFHTGCVSGATVFTGSCTAGSYNWSSTTNVLGYAWVVIFYLGDVSYVVKGAPLPVRAVRGGCVN